MSLIDGGIKNIMESKRRGEKELKSMAHKILDNKGGLICTYMN